MLCRRTFIKNSLLTTAAFMLPAPKGKVMTVTGPITPEAMGLTLVHEHVLVDFIGADKASPERYDADKVFAIVLPHLQSLKQRGCKTLVECTPMYLGRDVRLLRRLSQASGMQIITNTGWYGAVGEKYLPEKIKGMDAKEIAAEWTREAIEGIEGTGIQPGFMKISLDNLPFSENIRKILEAAAITYRNTGLPIGVHTSNGGGPALEQARIWESLQHPMHKWIWIHAQNEKDLSIHRAVARKGGWISFDGIRRENMPEYLERIKYMKAAGLLEKVIISHDGGYYDVVNPNQPFQDYNAIFDHFLPMLWQNGFTKAETGQLLIENPRILFTT